ncbi:AhpC/TSA family protein [Lutibacter sp. A64]|uniref:TlpA disulfide reductase family protein n=1 Tax=Lutibacter sp. A64 TaxID=2918526 RepID=UPI001F05387C|nr:TlpA disulfide reductase family protein [Lutibacter sp. A64]UMB53921.1 AhpC/TSA family protein [Lutibacter sp. A64]
MKKITIILLILITGCNSTTKKVSPIYNYSIDATIKGFKENTMVYLYKADIKITNPKPLDSANIIDGKFKFQGNIEEPFLAMLYFRDDVNSRTPSLTFWMDFSDMVINANLNSFNSDFVRLNNEQLKGSYLSELNNEIKSRRDSLNKAGQRSKIYDESINFIFKNPNNYYSVWEAYNFRTSLLQRNLLQKYYDTIDEKFKNSINGKLIKELLDSKKIVVGEHFTDIIAKDLDNKPIKLSDFKGKVILLDFWSTNCQPCRKQIRDEFPILKEKYNKEDFVIVNYSLDTDYNTWRKTSISDGIDWINIADLKGYKSTNVLNYQVRSIPKSIIIDKEGIIQHIKLGYKAGTLEKELDKLL